MPVASGVTATYNVAQPSPTASPAPTGVPVAGPLSVSLAAANITPNVDGWIIYTLDGTTPGPGSPTYSSPLSVTRDTLIRTYASRWVVVGSETLQVTSAVVGYQYLIGGSVAAPTVTPTPGAYQQPVTASLAGPTGATLHFTRDNTPATTASPIYTGPFLIPATQTVRAVAALSGQVSSELVAKFTICTVPPAPTANPLPSPAGHTAPLTVQLLTSVSAPYDIYYTVDGTTPSPGGG